MLSLSEKIKNVEVDSLKYGTLFFGTDNKRNKEDSVFYIWRDKKLERFLIGFPIISAVKIERQIIVTDDESKLWLLNEDFKIISKIVPDQFSNISTNLLLGKNKRFIITDNGDVFNSEYTLFKLNSLKEIFKTKHLMRSLSNSFLVLEKENMSYTGIVELYDLEANILWKKNLNDYFRYTPSIFTEIGGKYLLITNHDYVSLYFDLMTGELLWKSDDLLLRFAKPNYDGKKLISFNQGYVEFDIKTGERRIDRNAREKYPEFGSDSPYFWHSGDVIITVDSRRNKIYFYDIIHDEMIYVHEEIEAKPYLTAQPIYYHDGHVFVKTFDTNILFVYEVDKLLKDKLEKQTT